MAASRAPPSLSCRVYWGGTQRDPDLSGKVQPEGAPGHLIIVVGAGVVLAVVLQALLLAGHV